MGSVFLNLMKIKMVETLAGREEQDLYDLESQEFRTCAILLFTLEDDNLNKLDSRIYC